jgi:hypothetical protein
MPKPPVESAVGIEADDAKVVIHRANDNHFAIRLNNDVRCGVIGANGAEQLACLIEGCIKTAIRVQANKAEIVIGSIAAATGQQNFSIGEHADVASGGC